MAITPAEADAFNRAAVFHPQTSSDGLPAIEVAGVMVFLYVRDGIVRVSVDLDTPDPAVMPAGDCVPLEISIQGETVYEADEQGRETVHPPLRGANRRLLYQSHEEDRRWLRKHGG